MRHPWHHKLTVTPELAFRIELGMRLRSARCAQGKSIRQLADEVGTNRSSISGYESGQRTIPLRTLARLTLALGVSVDEVLRESARGKAAE